MSGSTTTPPSLTSLAPNTIPPKLINRDQDDVVPREACAPSLNATALVDTPDLTPVPASIQTTTSGARVGRSGTIKKGSAGTRAQQQQASTDAGYEGEVERHGQPNDFIDAESDEDASGAPIPTKSEFHVKKKKLIPIADIPNFLKPDNQEDPVKKSTLKNRNPSTSSHCHPARLPLQRNGTSHAQGRPRASSISSTRSHEAGNHPFPTPGHKFHSSAKESTSDDWKSVEEQRLQEDEKKLKHWKRWGPYVSERQWVSDLITGLPKFLSLTTLGE